MLPAYCEPCGIIFDASPIIGIGGGIRVRLTSVHVRCPRCKGHARVGDGVYQLVDDMVTLITDSRSTLESFRFLQKVLREAAQRGATAEEAVQEAANALPQFPWLRKYATKALAVVAATALATITEHFVSQMLEPAKLPVDEVIEFVTNVFERVLDGSTGPNTAPNPPPPRRPGNGGIVRQHQPGPADFPISMEKIARDLAKDHHDGEGKRHGHGRPKGEAEGK